MMKETEEFCSFDIRTGKAGTLCAVFLRQQDPECLYGMGIVPRATGSTALSPEEWLNEGALTQRIQDRETAGHDVSMSKAALAALHKRKAELTP